MNKTLSICIPTYNRVQLLSGCLDHLIPQARKHGIAIYVSDNASTDATSKVVSAAKKKYRNIFYRRNVRNIGPDLNEMSVLKMSKSRYAWLLGDKYRISHGRIDDVLAILEENRPDLLIVNTGDKARDKNELVNARVKDIDGDRIYRNRNELLEDLGWHMTLISSLIFGRDIIRKGRFSKYAGTNFIHVGVIFDYLARRDFTAYWYSRPSVFSAGWFDWADRIFEICAEKWPRLIFSLPDAYSAEAKAKCIKDHGIKSTVFTFSVLVKLRGLGFFDLEKFRRYKKCFPAVTNVPVIIMYLISITPVPRPMIDLLRRIKARMDEREYLDAKR